MTEWIKTIPPTPGRYWWRDSARDSYGMCLVRWQRLISFSDQEKYNPTTCVESYTIMHRGPYGGEGSEVGGSWGLGGSQMSEGVEFYPEPITAPPGLTLAPLPGPQEPPTPEAISKKKAEDEVKRQMSEDRERLMEKAKEKQLADAKASKTTLYVCTSCEELLDSNQLVQLRECPHCNETFDASDGNNCPSCNRPFTRVISNWGCPDCLEEVEKADEKGKPTGEI